MQFMRKKVWVTFVDVITAVWLVLFVCGTINKDEDIREHCALAILCLLPVFILDLILLCKNEENFKTFIKKKWFDVLLVIPYFRIFRICRLMRFVKILKMLKVKKALGITRFTKKSKRIVKSVAVNKLPGNS